MLSYLHMSHWVAQDLTYLIRGQNLLKQNHGGALKICCTFLKSHNYQYNYFYLSLGQALGNAILFIH